MQAVRGTYKNGRIKLSRKPRFRKEVNVTVLFHRDSSQNLPGLTSKQIRRFVGLFGLGGDASEDTERLYS